MVQKSVWSLSSWIKVSAERAPHSAFESNQDHPGTGVVGLQPQQHLPLYLTIYGSQNRSRKQCRGRDVGCAVLQRIQH
jgi:hypothetical protein